MSHDIAKSFAKIEPNLEVTNPYYWIFFHFFKMFDTREWYYSQKKWNNPPIDLINFVCCSVNGENIQSLMSSATFEITVTWRQWHYTTQHRWLRFWQPLGRLAILRIYAVVWPYKNSLELYHKTVQENWKKSLIPSTNRAMRSRNKQNMLAALLILQFSNKM